MKTIGSFEAKTHLAKILDEVSKGENYLITKHGRPVAELRPFSKVNFNWAEKKLFLKKFRHKISEKATTQEIEDWKNEGRR